MQQDHEWRVDRLAAFLDSMCKPMTEGGMIQWLKSFEDLSDDEFEAMLDRASKELREFPTPPNVRQFAGKSGLVDSDRATLAWAKVRETIRKVGGYETVKFDDPLITAAIREMVGWVHLCETTTEDMKWRERDFRSLYAAVAKSGIGDASPLPGICDRTNSKLGYSPQQPAVAVATGLPVHPSAPALPAVEREPMRLEHRFGQVVNGALVDHVREVIESKPEPVKDTPRDAESERAKLLAAYPEAGAPKDGKAAS